MNGNIYIYRERERVVAASWRGWRTAFVELVLCVVATALLVLCVVKADAPLVCTLTNVDTC
jgi:hypothetical protein